MSSTRADSAAIPPGGDQAETGTSRRGRHRLLLLIVIWLVGALAAMLLVVWAVEDRDDTESSPSTTQAGPLEPPSVGGIIVTDQGFVYDTRDGIGVISYGLEFSNTSSLVAVGVTVRVEFADSNGNLLRGADDQSGWQNREFNRRFVLPGQTYGTGTVGRWGYLPDGTGLNPQMSVQVTVDEWWVVDSEPDVFREVTAFDVELKLTPPKPLEAVWPPAFQNQPPRDNWVSFRTESEFEVAMRDTYFSGVFRGADGKIIGGWDASNLRIEQQHMSPGEGEPDLKHNPTLPPGQSEETFVFPISSSYGDDNGGILAHFLFADSTEDITVSLYMTPGWLCSHFSGLGLKCR